MKLIKSCIGMGLLCLASSSLMAAPLTSNIAIKNTHATYVNSGICSLAFDLVAFDFLNNVKEIEFKVTLKDKKGKLISNEEATASEFDMAGGRTFGTFFIESEKACEAFGETVVFNKAIVYYNDGTKPEDIVRTKKLEVDSFKPVKVVIGNK